MFGALIDDILIHWDNYVIILEYCLTLMLLMHF